ncbi:epoxide hydrolase [Pseudonocardia ailaonensis]|uniref:Epoxide hydrolase n=1 Tax=Pseudonocardia ailaonensis TaxID=367279 RepID=A0ABN2NIU3_9PSEU
MIDAATDRDLEPYTVSVPDAELAELRERLRAARLPDELPDASWRDGMLPAELRSLRHEWADSFDWRAVEAMLNAETQWLTTIDGTGVHCLDVRSGRPGAVPLLLLHGWPSSVAEFRSVWGPLTAPENGSVAFDAVVPSLPGFGFSGPTRERGWDADRMADAMAVLMSRLGHERFVVHGGDVGSEVATALSRRHPERVIGLHLNLGGTRGAGEHRAEPPANEAQRRAFGQYDAYRANGSAYAAIQATRPQTVAFALTDSPVGLLAWIAEKFREWADPAHPVTGADILTAASIYWFTGTVGSSARFYQESFAGWAAPGAAVTVPVAVCAYPFDIVTPVREWAEGSYDIVQWRDLPDGGHFPALETPHHLIDSVRAFAAALT